MARVFAIKRGDHGQGFVGHQEGPAAAMIACASGGNSAPLGIMVLFSIGQRVPWLFAAATLLQFRSISSS